MTSPNGGKVNMSTDSGSNPLSKGPPSHLKIMATGLVFSLLCGSVIAFTVYSTRDSIAANKLAWTRKSISAIVPCRGQASQMKEPAGFWKVDCGEPSEHPAAGQPDNPAKGLPGHKTEEPTDQSGRSYYAIQAIGQGFNEHIELMFCYDPVNREICGLTVLDHRETPGLGDRIETDQAFLSSFRGLSLSEPEWKLKSPRHSTGIDAITGATISSQAIVRILNKARTRLEGFTGEEGL